MILSGVLVAWMTYELSKWQDVGPIKSSVFFGLVVYAFAEVCDCQINIEFLFGATFVGMCSEIKFQRLQVILAAVAYYFIYGLMSQKFIGVGGTLGMSAFLSVCFIYCGTYLWRQWAGFKEI